MKVSNNTYKHLEGGENTVRALISTPMMIHLFIHPPIHGGITETSNSVSPLDWMNRILIIGREGRKN